MRYKREVSWGLLRARLKLMSAAALTVIAPTAVSSTAVILDLLRGPESPASASAATTTAPSPLGPLTPVQLAERYAPILRLDSDEVLLPINRDLYVKSTGLWKNTHRPGKNNRVRLSDGNEFSTLPTSGPPCPQRLARCHYYLQLQGRKPTAGVGPFLALQENIFRHGGHPVVYWHWSDADNALEYWFFYDFNYFTNWHASDWEQITLALDPATQKPVRLGYSSHEGGQGTEWAILIPGFGQIDDHPVVFVARGSHANYFDNGSHPVRECRFLGPKICRPDRADGLGPQLTLAEYRLIPLDGTNTYVGDYGSGNFLRTPFGLRPIGKGVNVSDPQRRDPLWHHPTAWLRKNRAPDIPKLHP